MTIVVSRPIIPDEEKPATVITNDWAEDVVQSMIYGGLEVYDLSGTVTREDVEYCLSQPDVDTFIHYGHGLDHALIGSNGEPILDDYNLDLLKNKIVISINCESADHFGLKAIDAGAKTYIGYDKKVYVRYNKDLHDYVGFKEANNAWNTLRLDGSWVSMWDAFNKMADEYKYWIDIYTKNGYPEIAECLQKSYDSMLILGDETQYLPLQNPVELLPYNKIYPK